MLYLTSTAYKKGRDNVGYSVTRIHKGWNTIISCNYAYRAPPTQVPPTGIEPVLPE